MSDTPDEKTPAQPIFNTSRRANPSQSVVKREAMAGSFVCPEIPPCRMSGLFRAAWRRTRRGLVLARGGARGRPIEPATANWV